MSMCGYGCQMNTAGQHEPNCPLSNIKVFGAGDPYPNQGCYQLPPTQGWQCPVCKGVWAPSVRGCPICNVNANPPNFTTTQFVVSDPKPEDHKVT
jgi:hypothetical protein